MSSESESGGVSPAYRLIHHYRERAMAAVQRYNEALVNNAVAADIRRDLAIAALDYYHALYEAREEGALEEPWHERGIVWLEELAGQTITVEESLPRANGSTKTVEKPAILAVDARRFKDVILELNDIAKELGLSVNIDESTPRTELPDELMEDIEAWRTANLE